MSASTHIIVVNFNAGGWLQRSVKSALVHGEGLVTVVDNASSDTSVSDTQKACDNPRLFWDLNKENIGFAAANNQALRKVTADFAVLLNPDCELSVNTIELILQAFKENPRLGLASCVIKDEAGDIQATSKRRFPTPWSAFVRLLQLHRVQPNNPRFKNFDYGDQTAQPTMDGSHLELVEAISGAFMVARMDAIKDVGLLDEGYFMHCEDLDWCKRFSLAGWSVGFLNNTAVTHAKGVSSKTRPLGVLWNLHMGMIRFFDKFYFADTSLPLRWFVKLGIGLSFVARAVISIARQIVK